MDRSALATEWEQVYDRVRDQLQALKLDESTTAREAAAVIGDQLGRFSRVLAGYCASMDSGRVTVKG